MAKRKSRDAALVPEQFSLCIIPSCYNMVIMLIIDGEKEMQRKENKRRRIRRKKLLINNVK